MATAHHMVYYGHLRVRHDIYYTNCSPWREVTVKLEENWNQNIHFMSLQRSNVLSHCSYCIRNCSEYNIILLYVVTRQSYIHTHSHSFLFLQYCECVCGDVDKHILPCCYGNLCVWYMRSYLEMHKGVTCGYSWWCVTTRGNSHFVIGVIKTSIMKGLAGALLILSLLKCTTGQKASCEQGVILNAVGVQM